MRKPFILLAFVACTLTAKSQTSVDSLIQFSGIVMASDSLEAIPFANIYEIKSGRGTTSNYKGFFSFVAYKGDTISFSSVGYNAAKYVIPRNLTGDKYSVIQLLTQDTIYLSETIIYPWPSKEDFRNAFLADYIPDDYYDTARKNLEREAMKEMSDDLAFDANMNQDYFTKQLAQKIYYNGQLPPMRIFDVFAWKQFIEAWKRGDFKSK